MGLFGSLFTSASGMMAGTQATSMISTNIANINTTGYKRSEAAFYEMVADSLYNAGYLSGGVGTTRILRADQQGSLLQTSSTTDAAIVGNGFFPVRDSVADTSFMYTRNGTFTEDQDGLMRNAVGQILYAWPIAADGTYGTDEGSLEPADVNLFETMPLPTSAIEFSMNLDANEEPIDPHRLGGGATSLPVASLTDPHFTRSISTYDALGNEHSVTMEFRKIVGPMAHFTSSAGQVMELDDVMVDFTDGPTPSIVNGDTMQITDGTNTLDITFVNTSPADTSLNEVNTVEDLLDVINNFTDVGGAQLFDAQLTNEGQLLVRSMVPASTLDLTASSATVLGVGGLNFIQDPDAPADYTYEPDYDITGAAAAPYADQDSFPAMANTTNPNTRHWWEVSIISSDVGGGNPVTLRTGLVNFNGDGTMNATADADGNVLIDLGSVDYDPLTTGEETDLTIDVTNFSQLSGAYDVIYSSQNGAGIGLRTSTNISQDGTLSVRFSNGIETEIYKIPVVTFVSPTSLNDISGTAFEETEGSGAPTFNEAGTNGAGVLAGATLENANVDLGNEFGKLIVSQRAYSLNGQVIRAVDEMTSTLAGLKN